MWEPEPADRDRLEGAGLDPAVTTVAGATERPGPATNPGFRALHARSGRPAATAGGAADRCRPGAARPSAAYGQAAVRSRLLRRVTSRRELMTVSGSSGHMSASPSAPPGVQ